MKLMPASSARWMILIESSWSVLPHAPNIIAPRHSGLTCTPVRPSERISMGCHSTRPDVPALDEAHAGARARRRHHARRSALGAGVGGAPPAGGGARGPGRGGWVGRLPVGGAPILLALSLEHGRAFATLAAEGALVSLLSLTLFILAYGWCARWMGWLPAAA